jgi:dTDP-4-dehydrorhamnose reductase
MKVLITGASGLLGKYLINSANFNNTIYAICNSSLPSKQLKEVNYIQLNLLDEKELGKLLFELTPEIIIHTAGEGNVDIVQNSIVKYYELNVGVTKTIAHYAQNNSSKLVFISSNSVFGGSNELYADDSALNPINDYGKLKTIAERTIQTVNPKALIIRPILMYGWPNPNRRLNPTINWINQLRLGKNIKVVNDIYTQPLAVWDCASVIWKGIEIDAVGAVNVSGGKLISLYEFSLLTSKVFNLDSNLIEPVTSRFFQNLAPRPVKTGFDLQRLKNEFKITPDGPLIGLEKLKMTEWS